MKRLPSLLALLVLTCSLSACSAPGPWKGRVIDAETKQPIEGAVVVAVFYKSSMGIGESVQQFYDAKETLTNKDGYWEIPEYTGISLPLVRELNMPEFTIFKPGYGAFPHEQVSPQYTPVDMFLKDGAVVELPNWVDDEQKRLLTYGHVHAISSPFKRIPLLAESLNKELGYLSK